MQGAASAGAAEWNPQFYCVWDRGVTAEGGINSQDSNEGRLAEAGGLTAGPVEKFCAVSGASGAMKFEGPGSCCARRKFIDGRDGLGHDQLTLRRLRSRADSFGKHLQCQVGIGPNINCGREHTTAYPCLTRLGQAVTAGEWDLKPALAVALRNFCEGFSRSRCHAVV